MIGSILKDYEKSVVNLEKILDFHVRFEKVHPFEDYNGRVGRLIMMKECLRYGIDPFIIDDKRRGAYNRGIESWNTERGELISVTLEAQKRFQGKMELCNSVNVRILKILGESLFSLANEGWEGDTDGSQV